MYEAVEIVLTVHFNFLLSEESAQIDDVIVEFGVQVATHLREELRNGVKLVVGTLQLTLVHTLGNNLRAQFLRKSILSEFIALRYCLSMRLFGFLVDIGNHCFHSFCN